MRDNTERAFLALVKAGLFGHTETTEKILWANVNWGEVYRLAEEQSQVGLVAAGIDWFKVNDSRFMIPQAMALQFIGQTLQIEQRNKAMNTFIAELIDKMRSEGIYTLLVKGQGVAQCYEKPLWRTCGDIDLFLSKENYEKAKKLLSPMGEMTEPEESHKRHFAMKIDQWVVELHGTLRGGLSNRVDRVLDEVQNDVFFGGKVRSTQFQVSGSKFQVFQNANLNSVGDSQGFKAVQVFMPGVDCDVVYVFSHILQHYYKGGIGLRQICDWCRLLWSYHGAIDLALLEKRIRKAGLLDTWRAFGAFAVKYLGMPIEAMPLYIDSMKWEKKADKISEFILEVGNFGHNRDTSYYGKYPFLVRKAISFGRRLKDLMWHTRIFPLDSVRFLFGMTMSGLKAASHGE